MKINFMLIDDSEIDLFINQKNIEKQVANSNIKPFIRAKEALEYLSSLSAISRNEGKFFPDIIFLDLNMPEMNGFQFLENFSQIENNELKNIRIYLVSSSINSKDISAAEKLSVCKGFIHKPLTPEKVEQLVEQFVTTMSVK